ncbi:MAG: DsbA family protein [Myxococcota bacterium]|jgi:2-hydroxychromene-2-carboxylate isomerase|nr:DsbA family protein [Myxococcota bacterium]
MSFSSAIDEARLTVLLDLRQPLTYLALHPTIELGREAGIDINWLPVSVPSLKAPSQPGADDDRGVRHRRSRASEIAREIETYASAQGLVLRDYYRDPDPAAANVGWLWVREHAPGCVADYLAEIFRAYWALELDPSDEEAVAKKVAALGLEADGFEAWQRDRGPATLAALGEELFDRGMAVGAPVYWIDDELFWGGQHLEMIRWILGGRKGRGPI